MNTEAHTEMIRINASFVLVSTGENFVNHLSSFFRRFSRRLPARSIRSSPSNSGF